MTPRQQAARDARHLAGFHPATGRIHVREPANDGGSVVCTLAGDPAHSATMEQAYAICAALDRLAARKGADHPMA